MKATGIVRRIDDLGRVVIPKEIRRTMKMSEGTPLEIFIDKEGGVIFRKYSAMGDISESAQHVSDCVSRVCGVGVAVSDRDRIVAAAGIPRRELLDKPVSRRLEDIMRARKPFIPSEDELILPCDACSRPASAAFPIINCGNICGMLMLLRDDSQSAPTEESLHLAQLGAAFLGSETAQ